MAVVAFGSELIFDGFPSWDDAERFAEWVGDEYGRVSCVSTSAEGVQRRCMFPYELQAPVVTVRRDAEWSGEDVLEAAVGRFGGRFAGT